MIAHWGAIAFLRELLRNGSIFAAALSQFDHSLFQHSTVTQFSESAYWDSNIQRCAFAPLPYNPGMDAISLLALYDDFVNQAA